MKGYTLSIEFCELSGRLSEVDNQYISWLQQECLLCQLGNLIGQSINMIDATDSNIIQKSCVEYKVLGHDDAISDGRYLSSRARDENTCHWIQLILRKSLKRILRERSSTQPQIASQDLKGSKSVISKVKVLNHVCAVRTSQEKYCFLDSHMAGQLHWGQRKLLIWSIPDW